MHTSAAKANLSNESQIRVMPTASGHTMLLSAEDFPVYHLHMTRFLTELQPQNQKEADLVQRITDNEWRIDRIARLEMGLYAQGRLEFASLFADHDTSVRSLLIETHTHSTYARHLNNLSVQEARLRRYVEKDLADLQLLQATRLECEGERKAMAASASTHTHTDVPSKQNASDQNGFEFSNSISSDSNRSQSELPTYPSSKVTRH